LGSACITSTSAARKQPNVTTLVSTLSHKSRNTSMIECDDFPVVKNAEGFRISMNEDIVKSFLWLHPSSGSFESITSTDQSGTNGHRAASGKRFSPHYS
jgi:hypothetical protein